MSGEEIVRITGPNGPLVGILHLPQGEPVAKSCVIMLNAGLLSRVGPQRLYVKAARRWAAQGFAVLRLDMAGVGDSPADNDEIHFDTQAPEEVAAAVQYVRDRLGNGSIFLQGLCAGARAAIKTAANDPAIAGVLAWSCPIISAGEGSPKSPYEAPDQTSDWSARNSFERFLSSFTELKFLKPSWWRNRFEYGFSEIGELMLALRHFVFGAREVANPFLEASDRCLSSDRRLLFVFGERDRMPLEEFRQRFAEIPEDATLPQGFCVIPQGTHTFTSIATQDAVIEISGKWMAATCAAT